MKVTHADLIALAWLLATVLALILTVVGWR